jgi:mannose-6-phosphate isomerase-like protein (cupin superfamily)
VPDAVNLPLITAKERGAGGGHIRFNFAKSSLNSHISQFPIGTYKKAHAHGPGAHVIILSGEGYSLMWPEGDKPRYYKWEVGTMIVPPEHVAAPALQHRHDAGALSRLQARGRRDPQRPGRAEGLDQQAARRRPDRLSRRESGDAQAVRAPSSPSTASVRRWKRLMLRSWTAGTASRLRPRRKSMHDVPGQVHWHEPTGGKRAGFGKFGRPKTPYDNFMEAEGIPVFRDIGVSKVQNLPLAPWKRTGGRGTYIQLYGTEGKWGCYVVEVPGAGALNPEKHIYEEIYFVVEGRGTTEVWLEGENKRHVFEWQKNSLFSIPVNAMHRIVNASSRRRCCSPAPPRRT